MQNESTSPATSNVGTPTYMAPELIIGQEQYDGKVRTLQQNVRWCYADNEFGPVCMCVSAR